MKLYKFGKNGFLGSSGPAFNTDPLESLMKAGGTCLYIINPGSPVIYGEAMPLIDDLLMLTVGSLKPLWSRPESVVRCLSGDLTIRSIAAAQAWDAYNHYSNGRQVPDLPHPADIPLTVSAKCALVTYVVLTADWKEKYAGGKNASHIIGDSLNSVVDILANGVTERARSMQKSMRNVFSAMVDEWEIRRS